MEEKEKKALGICSGAGNREAESLAPSLSPWLRYLEEQHSWCKHKATHRQKAWLAQTQLHTTVTARIERQRKRVQTQTHNQIHIYAEYTHTEEKLWTELMPTCTQTVSLPLSYKQTHTKQTRNAETGRAQTAVRLTEYFIMFSLACQERRRSALCVRLYMCLHMCRLKLCIRVCWQFQFLVFLCVCVWL